MAETGNFIETDDFLIVRHSGEIDYMRALNIVLAAWQSGKLLERKRLLVDLRDTTLRPGIESDWVLRLAQAIAKIAQGKDGLHIANVIPNEEDRIRLSKFVESGARSLGANYKLFNDYDEAARWLKTIGPSLSISE
jgi:hypothetical protein